jgi:hypothetical protein
MNRMNEEWQAIPEWPRGYRRWVRNLYFAYHHPLHVGRFRDYAFPKWWRDLRKRFKKKWK